MATSTHAPRRSQAVDYQVVLEPSEEGGYTVYVPALRGCVSEGDTEAEALANIKDAIRAWHAAWKQVATKKGALVKKGPV